MNDVLIAAVAFCLMEGVTYLAHRFVMHGAGIVWHRSHHQARVGTFEANDLYPVVFAAVTILGMAAGASLPSLHFLLVVGIGVTAYGLSYLFVHDVYIHARLGQLPRVELLERLKRNHAIHHLYGGEPFGMLLPIVPKGLRQRAAQASYDPFGRVSRA